jgi:tetratricopeptide (TPR) repeat protein
MNAPPWRTQKAGAELLFLPALGLALVANGVVRPQPLAAMVAVGVGLWVLAGSRLAPGQRARLAAPAVAVALVALLGLVPVSEALLPPLRQVWIGELRAVLPDDPAWRRWAMDPIGGFRTLAVTAVPLGFGAAAFVSAAQGAQRRVLIGLASLGVGAAALAAVHLLSGAERILWGRELVHRGVAAAPFVNPNHLGLFLAASLPLLLGLAARPAVTPTDPSGRPFGWLPRAGWITLALLVAAVGWRARSKGFPLVAGAGLLGFVASRLRARSLRAALAPVAALLLLGAVVSAVPTLRTAALEAASAGTGEAARVDKARLWLEAGAMFVDAPLLGHGLGSFRIAHRRMSPPWSWSDAPHAESEPAQWLAEAGLLGLGLLVLAVGWMASGLLHSSSPRAGPGWERAALEGCLAALFVGALGDFLLRTGFGLGFLGAVLGARLGLGASLGGPMPNAARRWSAPIATAAGAWMVLAWTWLLGPPLARGEPGALAAEWVAVDHAAQQGRRVRAAGGGADEVRRTARSILEGASRAFPWSVETWVDLARIARASGDHERAVHCARVAAVNAPGDPRAALLEARSQAALGRRGLATAAYQRALASWPSDPGLLMSEMSAYGLSAHELAELPSAPPCAALRVWAESLAGELPWEKLGPALWEARGRCAPGTLAHCLAFGRLALASGEPQWALRWGEGCVAERRQAPVDAPVVAAALVQLDPQRGLELYARMTRERPGIEASLGYGRALRGLGRPAACADHLETVRRRHGEHLDVHRLWARCMTEAGRNALLLQEIDGVARSVASHPAMQPYLDAARRSLEP